jgi:3-deoxy-D-manno-octulosonate 8-phosphate phosphatase (KDO 8-P phosphatase)
MMKTALTAKIRKIKFIALDVDGVLTDGGIIIAGDGSELKRFDVKDGSGISLARHVGLKFAVISGRYSKVITLRAKELKIKAVYQGVIEKLKAYNKMKKKFKLKDDEICFIGDEIIDLPVFEKCGFSAAPADAVAEIKAAADYVCKKSGGRGCVREVINMILKSRGLWQKAVNRYLRYEKPIF